MATLRLVASLALVTACYQRDPDVYATLPEPVVVQGPPSGEIDPAWQASYVDDNASGATTAPAEASSDPSDPGYVMGAVSDGEIDATLDGYGEWVEVDGYGEVWRPYTTAVGVNFTPYETCGSWVWTDWGWTFACEWDWGWLPFHYGRWGWFDDYWAWVPDYEWSPAWVEWRGGGGYVGWRPLAPIVRDHRGQHAGVVLHDHRGQRGDGPRVRDHRTAQRAQSKDWQWRFAANEDFGKPRIRSHLFKSPAEGLRVTSLVPRPPVRATVQPVHAESIMRARLAFAARLGARDGASRVGPSRVEPDRGVRGVQPGRVTGWERPHRAMPASAADPSVYQPGYQAPIAQPPRAPSGDAVQPSTPEQAFGGLPVTPTTPTPEPDDHPLVHPRAPTYTAPTAPTQPSYQPPTTRPPRAPTYTAPTAPTQPTYQPPYQPPYHPPRGPTYTAPTPPSRAPERPSYTPPTYSPPSHSSSPSYSPPARSSSPSYSPPTYSPPSHSSSPASSGGGFSSGARSHRR